MIINGFSGEHRFLSNFWPSPITYKGHKWPCVENAYQWAKGGCLEGLVEDYQTLAPGKAKRFGKKLAVCENWDTKKVWVMLALSFAKYQQNPDLAEKLLATGNDDIVEFNSWGDVYWGQVLRNGKQVGENRLGRILMTVRSNLRGEGLIL
jgi:ribA/ribD-fused uncharacterized protein